MSTAPVLCCLRRISSVLWEQASTDVSVGFEVDALSPEKTSETSSYVSATPTVLNTMSPTTKLTLLANPFTTVYGTVRTADFLADRAHIALRALHLVLQALKSHTSCSTAPHPMYYPP